MNNDDIDSRRRAAVRTAAVIGTLVFVFYVGFILSHLWQ